MEENFSLERNSRDQHSLGSSNKASLSTSGPKHGLTYADLHGEITTNASENRGNEHLAGKQLKEEEIVRYMSNLPAYLERGNNLREKGLNVGVLDWGRLERWHGVQKQISGRNCTSASPHKQLSLCSSKDLSSPSGQIVHRPLLQSRAITSSASEAYPAVAFPTGLDLKNQVLKHLQSDTFNNGKKNFIRADRRSCRYGHCIEPEQIKKHCLVPKVLEMMKNGGEFIKMEDKMQASQKNITKSSSLAGIAALYSEIPREGNREESPSKTRILCRKNSIGAPMESGGSNYSCKVDLAESKVTVEKSRSYSPFSRLSIGLNRKIKGCSSIAHSDIPRQSSARTSVHPKSDGANDTTNLDASSNDKRRSSPLSKLLDPILKTKATICHHAWTSEKDSIKKTPITSKLMSESMTKQSRKVRLDMSRCRRIDVNLAVEDKKQVPTRVQALLQAVLKNGLPLLTFAVDNVSDVLATTIKSSGLDQEKTRIYTFFTIREVKKRIGSWINQGGTRKGRDFISNIVAQMKVSELQFSNLTRREKFHAKQFVLFSVNQRQFDQQNLDFQSDNELAAIVTKIPSMANSKRQHSAGHETSFNTTVILPSGNHSIPNKGGPSSLIERWNSGGSCDCGGWDLGCKLRILANSKQNSKTSSSSDQIVLSSQEGDVEKQPILGMTMLKDKIFSIEFGSTLSYVQAFAISIALLDSQKLAEFSLAEKSYDEIKAAHHGKLPAFNRVGDVPVEYIFNPPLSPFERV